MGEVFIIRHGKSGPFPEFAYTLNNGQPAQEGEDYKFITHEDSKENWELYLNTTGTLKFKYLGNIKNGADIYLVGGGKGGQAGWTTSSYHSGQYWYTDHDGASGAGGSIVQKSLTPNDSKLKNININVVIGSGGNGGQSEESNGANGGETSLTYLNQSFSASGGQSQSSTSGQEIFGVTYGGSMSLGYAGSNNTGFGGGGSPGDPPGKNGGSGIIIICNHRI